MRETFENGVKRADALIILGKDKHNLHERTTLPVFYGHTEVIQTATTKKDVLAFAGIGHPQKFYHSLQSQGLNVVEKIDFPDHHFYQKEELENLFEKAEKLNADLYTTSKDFVKIPPSMQKYFNVLEIAVVWDEPEKLTAFIKEKINAVKNQNK